MPAVTFHQRCEDMEFELDQARKVWLRKNGWRETCKTPGAFWLWEKQIEAGRSVIVQQDLAISIQSSIDMLGGWPVERSDDVKRVSPKTD